LAVWWKELTHSKSFWKEYLKDKKLGWDEYSRRYKLELLNNPLASNALHNLALLDKNVNQDINQKKQEGFVPQCSDMCNISY
jgi:uncharacterized protein YeaO (DUF488 family)